MCDITRSAKPSPAQVVARMLLRRDVRMAPDGHSMFVAGAEVLGHVTDVDRLRDALEPVLVEAVEAGRLMVLGDLREPVLEHGICATCGALCDSACPECRVRIDAATAREG